MAVLAWPGNAVKVWSTGSGQIEAAIEVKNASAGDSLDVGVGGGSGGNIFQRIYGVTGLVTGGTAVLYASASPTFTGTVITIPAGPSASVILITVVGISV